MPRRSRRLLHCSAALWVTAMETATSSVMVTATETASDSVSESASCSASATANDWVTGMESDWATALGNALPSASAIHRGLLSEA